MFYEKLYINKKNQCQFYIYIFIVSYCNDKLIMARGNRMREEKSY